jgi:hypothetical protein
MISNSAASYLQVQPLVARTRRLDRSHRLAFDWVRIVCHVVAEVPFLALCVVELAVGWRPTFDDAIFAWRAWDVFSSHPPLVGAATHGVGASGQMVFAPGPVLSWLLAIPVHIDPLHGALWGSALLGALAAGLAVEAGRAAAGHCGMVVAVGGVLALGGTQVGVFLNPVWTPWIGGLYFLTTLAAGWATGVGHLRWWIVVVVAGSVSAQSHVIYALPVVGVCVVAPVIGLFTRRNAATTARLRSWLAPGVAIGAVLWMAPLVQQLADRPGNLLLLWRSSHRSGGRVGIDLALEGYGSATSPIPSWTHRLPYFDQSTFFETIGTVFRSSTLWGIIAGAVVVFIAVVATVTRRPSLAAAGYIAASSGLLTVLTVAAVPNANFLEFGYLNIIFWPVGMAAWLVIAFGLLELLRVIVRLTLQRTVINRWRRSLIERVPGGLWRPTAVALVMIAASTFVIISTASLVPSNQSELQGPSAVNTSAAAVAAVRRVMPRGPFLVEIEGPQPASFAAAVQWDVVYALAVTGGAICRPLPLVCLKAKRHGNGRHAEGWEGHRLQEMTTFA